MTTTRMMSVKLFGGPLDGVTLTLPATAESYSTPGRFWTYTYAGKDGGLVMFAKQPTQRKVRKFISWYIGKHGRSPVVEAQYAKSKPFRHAEGRKVARAKARAARKAAS